MIRRGTPVEVVPGDVVGGFQLTGENEMLSCTTPAGQQLPLHLGGQAEPLSTRSELEQVGVSAGHNKGVAESGGKPT